MQSSWPPAYLSIIGWKKKRKLRLQRSVDGKTSVSLKVLPTAFTSLQLSSETHWQWPLLKIPATCGANDHTLGLLNIHTHSEEYFTENVFHFVVYVLNVIKVMFTYMQKPHIQVKKVPQCHNEVWDALEDLASSNSLQEHVKGPISQKANTDDGTSCLALQTSALEGYGNHKQQPCLMHTLWAPMHHHTYIGTQQHLSHLMIWAKRLKKKKLAYLPSIPCPDGSNCRCRSQLRFPLIRHLVLLM